MKVASVMSCCDSPPQSCVLSVIWTCGTVGSKELTDLSVLYTQIKLCVGCTFIEADLILIDYMEKSKYKKS